MGKYALLVYLGLQLLQGISNNVRFFRFLSLFNSLVEFNHFSTIIKQSWGYNNLGDRDVYTVECSHGHLGIGMRWI